MKLVYYLVLLTWRSPFYYLVTTRNLKITIIRILITTSGQENEILPLEREGKLNRTYDRKKTRICAC